MKGTFQTPQSHCSARRAYDSLKSTTFFSTDFFTTDFAEKERLLVAYQLAGSKPVGYLQVKSWNRTKDYPAINRSGGQGGVGPKMPDYESPRSPQNH